MRLRLRAPVPDLGTIGKGVDVASFVSQAVEHEFDGPPLAPRTARALAALVSVLAPYTSPVAETCVVDGASLLAVGLRLCAMQMDRANTAAEEVDFIRDSLRFFVGELSRTAAPEINATLLAETNRTLRTGDLADQGCGGRARVIQLAARWEAARLSPQQPLSNRRE